VDGKVSGELSVWTEVMVDNATAQCETSKTHSSWLIVATTMC
jgi:hypothetical protein